MKHITVVALLLVVPCSCEERIIKRGVLFGGRMKESPRFQEKFPVDNGNGRMSTKMMFPLSHTLAAPPPGKLMMPVSQSFPIGYSESSGSGKGFPPLPLLQQLPHPQPPQSFGFQAPKSLPSPQFNSVQSSFFGAKGFNFGGFGGFGNVNQGFKGFPPPPPAQFGSNLNFMQMGGSAGNGQLQFNSLSNTPIHMGSPPQDNFPVVKSGPPNYLSSNNPIDFTQSNQQTYSSSQFAPQHDPTPMHVEMNEPHHFGGTFMNKAGEALADPMTGGYYIPANPVSYAQTSGGENWKGIPSFDQNVHHGIPQTFQTQSQTFHQSVPQFQPQFQSVPQFQQNIPQTHQVSPQTFPQDNQGIPPAIPQTFHEMHESAPHQQHGGFLTRIHHHAEERKDKDGQSVKRSDEGVKSDT